MPKRCTRPGTPCSAGPSMTKSAGGSPGSVSFGRACDRLRAKARAVHDRVDRDGAGLGPAEMHLPAAIRAGEAFDLGVEGEHAARLLEVALEREHEGVAVDDAGLRAVHGRDAR